MLRQYESKLLGFSATTGGFSNLQSLIGLAIRRQQCIQRLVGMPRDRDQHALVALHESPHAGGVVNAGVEQYVTIVLIVLFFIVQSKATGIRSYFRPFQMSLASPNSIGRPGSET